MKEHSELYTKDLPKSKFFENSVLPFSSEQNKHNMMNLIDHVTGGKGYLANIVETEL